MEADVVTDDQIRDQLSAHWAKTVNDKDLPYPDENRPLLQTLQPTLEMFVVPARSLIGSRGMSLEDAVDVLLTSFSAGVLWTATVLRDGSIDPLSQGVLAEVMEDYRDEMEAE